MSENKMSVQFVTVDADEDGQRVDRWISKKAPAPFGIIQKLIRKGVVRIDGKRTKPESRVAAGQEVKIPAALYEEHAPKPKREMSDEDAKYIRDMVIYEDEAIIAINKPSGIASQGGTKTRFHIDGLLPALADKDGHKPHLVHRLDKDTSGIMLLAKSSKIAKILGENFKKRSVKKIYWALVSPAPETMEGSIKAPLIKSGGKNKEIMVVDEEEGKFALTDFAVIEHAHEQGAFMAFWPRTGRTHQIRAHAALMGSAIIGDRKYKAERDPESKKPEADFSDLELADRLHLHAHRLILPHPVRGTKLDLKAPLPPELVKSWRKLGFNPKSKGDPFLEE